MYNSPKALATILDSFYYNFSKTQVGNSNINSKTDFPLCLDKFDLILSPFW